MESDQKNVEKYQSPLSSPQKLIVFCQGTILKIVDYLIRRGFFASDEKHDLVQHINLQLLEKGENIRKNYDGRVPLDAYLSVVVRNICIRYKETYTSRSLLRVPDHFFLEKTVDPNPGVFSKMVVSEEIERLETILSLYADEKEKLLIVFRLIVTKTITPEKILSYYGDISVKLLEDVFSVLSSLEQLKRKEIFKVLIPLVNSKEGKKSTPDTLRKWFDRRVQEIIHLINGNPPRSFYSKETLLILFEYYFEKR
ncbi:MAG: hypothetical protein FJY10_05670 [Bacteroidetes bacterium]|nr:hypothetical protein [Bacteroidota bacterium]